MSYGQGDVVVATDPFGHAPRRPYLVVSNERRPFQGEDYLVAGITTTARTDAIPLADEFDAGRLDRTSYVSPWTVPRSGTTTFRNGSPWSRTVSWPRPVTR